MNRNSDWAAQLKQPRMLLRGAIAVLLAANLAMAIVAFKPFGGSANDLRRQEAALRSQLAAARARIAIGKRLTDKVETARSQGDNFLAKYMVDRRNASSAVYEELTRMGTEAGIQLGQITNQFDAIEGSDTLQMLTISADLAGTYPQITKFVDLVDKSPRFFVIESMQTSAPQQNGPQNAQRLTVAFKIKTFVRGAVGDAS
jgi:Tfp pilus assembly protein PilO